LIQLAKEHPDTYFMIKGKNNTAYHIPEMEGTMAIIHSSSNMGIEEDHEVYSPYKLAAIADAAIAVHTSLGDEMLAAGKPVLFYDYLGFPSAYFDYEGYPVIAYSYEELSERLRDIKKGRFMGKTKFDQMRERFYTANNDGKVKEILQKELLKIYHST
jgi:hypothetical protein